MQTPTVPRLSRRGLLAGGLALGASPLVPRLLGSAGASRSLEPDSKAFGFDPADMTSQIVRPIVFPVDGPVSWSDTYGACRDGCTRFHEGQDLLGAKLERLVACVTGTVVGFKYSSTGNYLYLADSDGWYYGYLHINNDTPGTDDGLNPRNWAFAPGIDIGSQVQRGQLIAYMGDSGNAENTQPHLHFEIRKPSSAWYRAAAVNAKYSLYAASHVAPPPSVPPATFTPWTTAGAFITQQYVDFVGRQPATGELDTWQARLNGAQSSPADLVEAITAQPGSDDTVAPLLRLYSAILNRLPDSGGLMYWISELRRGVSLDAVAVAFARGSEFTRRYGSLSDADFVDQVYRTVLSRPADSGGRAYWVGRLRSGTSRGLIVRALAESNEYRWVTYHRTRICMVYAGMMRRAPDGGGFIYWIDQVQNKGMPLQSLIGGLQMSPEYRRRF